LILYGVEELLVGNVLLIIVLVLGLAEPFIKLVHITEVQFVQILLLLLEFDAEVDARSVHKKKVHLSVLDEVNLSLLGKLQKADEDLLHHVLGYLHANVPLGEIYQDLTLFGVELRY